MIDGLRGVALAGGGPLGAVYEIGALAALDEALRGFHLNDCSVYVGVSSGSFIAAGLANGLTPRDMHWMFIESETAQDPFEPDILLRPAVGEYGGRLATVPALVMTALHEYLQHPCSRGFVESFQRLGRALPTGIFDNAGIGKYLTKLFAASGRTNDFRKLEHKLFIVATDLDSGQVAPFGAPGWDHVPIAKAVQASAALPGLFPPVMIDGRWYVDGVMKKTLHASLALREGARLLLCINPLVPFTANTKARSGRGKRFAVVDGGLPLVLSQTFRAIIHSRMEVGMSRYAKEFPKADVVLLEPGRDDAEMFFTNVFSYADRRRLCEHAYQQTRAQLRRRYDELTPILARHGVTIDRAVLDDRSRTLLVQPEPAAARENDRLAATMRDLDQALDRLGGLVKGRVAARKA